MFYRSNHPFAKLLHKHGTPWRAVASSVNVEFRRITKFSSIIGGTSIYITDSWIIKCSAYKADIAHQPDVHLSIIHAEDHDISHESNVAVQFLNIKVFSITPGTKPFVIRLNSTDYGDLREKLQAPVRNARNVVIHQSLSDKFIEAFKEQVSQNEVYRLQEGEEVCCGLHVTFNSYCEHLMEILNYWMTASHWLYEGSETTVWLVTILP